MGHSKHKLTSRQNQTKLPMLFAMSNIVEIDAERQREGKHIYIYIYICWRGTGLSTFWPPES